MNPHPETRSPAPAANPQSLPADPSPQPPNPSPRRRRGAPRILDEAKRREICALVAGGCTTREAARYVHCSYQTIRRELRRDPEFHASLRHSEMYAQLKPLRAMQHAAATHWRAAAWMLERAYPNRFGRRDSSAFGPRQARGLLAEVLNIIGGEVHDPFQRQRIENRLRATFEYTIRAACDQRRTNRDLRTAMKFFEEKRRLNDPFAQFGFPTPDFASVFQPKRPQKSSGGDNAEPKDDAAPAGEGEAPANTNPALNEINAATLADLATALGGLL